MRHYKQGEDCWQTSDEQPRQAAYSPGMLQERKTYAQMTAPVQACNLLQPLEEGSMVQGRDLWTLHQGHRGLSRL